jgi:hypothetical protein
MVLLVIVVLLNVPVYLFLGWLAFDSKDGAAETFGETILALLQILFVPRIVRVLLGWDDEGALGLVPIAIFFIACAAVTYGELYLLNTMFPGNLPDGMFG